MSDFENSGSEEVETSESSVAENDFTPDYSSLNSSLNEPENTDTGDNNSEPDNSGESRNPAWDPILNLIPEQLHSQVIPHLSKTDKHVQELQQRYAPYKGIIEQGVSPDAITNSLTLARAIQENPQAVYDEMREQFGLTHEQAIQVMEDADEDDDSQGLEYGDEEDSDFSGEAIENHPIVVQLREQVEALNQVRQEQAMIEMQDKIRNDVAAEWSEIEKIAGGNLSQSAKDDIAQRALQLAGDNGVPSLMDGFKAHVRFVSEIRNSSANNSAPPVADGTGLLPSSRTYDKSTPEGRQAFIADFARSLTNGGN